MATQTRNPTSDEAASGTLTGSAGSRWTLVDDHPDTTGADSITFGTTTAQITFGFSAFTVPAGATDISVSVNYLDGEAANGANNCGGRIKVGSSYFNAATHNPAGTGWTSRTDTWATNPAGGAWTVDQVNGIGANALAAFGIGSTDSNPTFRVSSVQLEVTYTPPLDPRSATVAITQDHDAVSASSAVATAASVAITQAADVVAASTTVEDGPSESNATVSIAQASDTITAASAVAVQAQAAITQGADAVTCAAAVAIAASVAIAQASDSVTASSAAVIAAAVSITQAADEVSGAIGAPPNLAAIEVVQAADSVATTSVVACAVIAAITQTSDAVLALVELGEAPEIEAPPEHRVRIPLDVDGDVAIIPWWVPSRYRR